MNPDLVLPAIGGLALGILLALIGSSLYLRARLKTCAALLADAT